MNDLTPIVTAIIIKRPYSSSFTLLERLHLNACKTTSKQTISKESTTKMQIKKRRGEREKLSVLGLV